MKKYIPFIVVGVVALAALGSGFALYRAKHPAALTSGATDERSTSAGGTTHVLGNVKARVTLEEYGDFECPPCGRLSEPLDKIVKDFQPNVRLIFHNFPLIVHAHAREAAHAAEAAALQNKFWEMHDLIYREQAIWSKAPEAKNLFIAYAGKIGLDVEKFKKDVESDVVKDRVNADQKHGESLGVKNTPTIFLNNKALDPKDLNPDNLRVAVEAAIKGKPSS